MSGYNEREMWADRRALNTDYSTMKDSDRVWVGHFVDTDQLIRDRTWVAVRGREDNGKTTYGIVIATFSAKVKMLHQDQYRPQV